MSRRTLAGMSTAEGSERTSDRLLAAFLVGAAGPLAGLLAVLVVLPLMAIATFAAFVLTGASHPFLAGIAAVVLAPVWNWVVEALPLPGLPVYLAVLGLLPATSGSWSRRARRDRTSDRWRPIRQDDRRPGGLDGDGVLHVGAARAVARS